MKCNFVDCLMVVGTALSLRGDQRFAEMGRPLLQDVFTTRVNVSLTISSLHFKNLKNMEVLIEFSTHQKWTDPRLDADDRTRRLAVNGQVWRPKLTTTEGDSKEDENTEFWRGISPEGNIIYSEKIILNTFCSTDFQKFPFDTQYCFIKLGTYRFPIEEVNLVWDEHPIENNIHDLLKEFQLINIETTTEVVKRPSGSFTVLITRIAIKRDISHYIFCSFSPCILFVCITYLVFWIHPTFMKFRMVLNLINLFSLIYLFFYSSNFVISPIFKAIDIFITICIFFVLYALLENIIVLIRKKEERKEVDKNNLEENENNSDESKWIRVDYFSIWLYPVMFICIVIIYSMIFIA